MPHSVIFFSREAGGELLIKHFFLKTSYIAAERFRVFPRAGYFFLNSLCETAENFEIVLNGITPLELVVGVVAQLEDVLRRSSFSKAPYD